MPFQYDDVGDAGGDFNDHVGANVFGQQVCRQLEISPNADGKSAT